MGIDTFDEVWEGSYHVAPAAHPAHGYVDNELAVLLAPFAAPSDLWAQSLRPRRARRLPSAGSWLPQRPADSTWVPTAAVVVEIVSPDDETYDKFGFYAAHGVDGLIVTDPAARTVTCWARTTGRTADRRFDTVGQERAAKLHARHRLALTTAATSERARHRGESFACGSSPGSKR